MFRYVFIAFFLVVMLPAYAMSDASQWAKVIPGASLISIERTLDDGYVAAGSKNNQAMLVRFDSSGNMQWAKTYGNNASASMVYQAEDGGFVLTGSTDSNGGDAFFMKVDATGNILFQRAYGTPSYEEASVILRTSDGGFFLLGNGSGIWCMKLNSKREIPWVRIYGQAGTNVSAATATNDGGLIMAGTRSGSGMIVVKLGPNGNINWQKQYGAGYAEPRSITTTSDGGYVVGGVLHFIFGVTGWAAKLDPKGNTSWRKGFNNMEVAEVTAVRQETDGHILVMGSVGVGHQRSQIWSARLTPQGEIGSQLLKEFGESKTRVEFGVSAIHGTFDDGTVVVGSRQRDSSMGSFVLRTSPAGDICTAFQKSTTIRIFDLDWKTESVHVGNREVAFDERRPNFTPTPLTPQMVDLCR